MAKKRDFDELEKRRIKGAKLLKEGVYPAEVSRRLGVSRTSVHRWESQLKANGIKSLRKVGRAGRKSKMDDKSRERIVSRIKAGALASGFGTDLWTLKRIASIIKEETGLIYTDSGVWRFLSAIGFSSQKPTTQAIQRDEKAIKNWKTKRWPLLKKTPDKNGKQ